MDQRRQREICLLAETVRESLELQVPVDVEEAVRRLGGNLVENHELEEGMEAKVSQKGERFEIVIHDGKPKARKRFSVAHELGHLLLHMGYLVDPERWSKSDEYRDSVYYRFGHGIEEEEANAFAAAFLMPEADFRDIARRYAKDGLVSVEKVARHFLTSKDATMVRGSVLGVFRAPS
jgi:Zn-dependent peptidase ImmA (M78 family)